MSYQRSTKSRTNPRSPAPTRTPTTPSQHFFPPSHYAAAAGVSYPFNRGETTDEQSIVQVRAPLAPNQRDSRYQEAHPFSSNAMYQASERSSHTSSRSKRKSQIGELGLMEAHLLPSLRDTVDRMTKQPYQTSPASPFHPLSGPDCAPGVARTPSCSSQSSSAYSEAGRSEPHGAGTSKHQISSLEQPIYYSPSDPPPAHSPMAGRLSSKSNPKPILKSPGTFDQRARQPVHGEGVGFHAGHPSTALKNRVEHAYHTPVPSSHHTKYTMQGSRRTGRARSRTDPGTLPASLSSSRGRNTQQPGHQPSNIPRRIGVSPSPAPYRPSNGAQVSDSGSDAGTVNSGQRDKRKLYVTNAEITSSSSSESQSSKTPFTNPRTPSRADSQSSTETKLRPPRFGLGLGFSGVNDPKSSMRSPQAWSTKIPTIESSPIHRRRIETPDDRGPTRDGIPKGHDRPPSRNANTDNAEGQRRHRELLSLVEAATYDSELSNECDSLASISSGYDPLPASGRGSDRFDEQYAASAGSRSSLACDDSGSEYSPAEEHDEEAIRRPSLRRERTQSRTVSGVRQSRVDLFRDSGDNQHTPKASSSSSFVRHDRDYDQIHPSNQPADDFAETESLILTSDEDSSSLEETRGVSERYSSELSRIMAVSNEAAAQQRQAFGIGSSLGFEDHRPGAASTLPHADSDLSSVGGEGWQYECDDLDTGSLLQQLSRPDTSGSSDKQSLADEHSLISAQTQSSMSQESIYSTQNSPTRRETIIYEFPSSSLTERDHKWGEFERHVLHCYGREESRRQRFVWELADSEENFVGQLRNMVQLFILPLRVRDTRLWVSGVPGDVAKLFDWLEDIVQIHAQLFAALGGRQVVDHSRLQVISEVFRAFIPRLETYQPYLVKLEFVATLIDSLVHDGKSDFGDFINLQEASERCRGWSLEKYLIEPVNRLAQYPELFRRLLHLTPKTHPDYLSTLSLFHAAKLTIRVLSEVKDREDVYELVKVACARVRGVPSVHLAKRERRLLMRGPLTCVEVNSDEQVLAPNHGQHSPRSEVPPSQRHRRADKLSQAVRDWRGRSNSVKSTASTVASFSTAPSSFDVRMGQPANVVGTPIVRVESEPLEVEVFVFTDLVLLASPLNVDHHVGEGTEECSMEPLEGFGLSRILSVLDEIDRRSRITLDLVPLTCQELEEGRVHSSGPVVTIALSQCTSVGGRTGLGEWLPPFRQCCQYTLKSLSSLSTKGFLVHGTTSEPEMQKPVLSILASGLPFPKSPSMQIEESQHGRVVDSEQEEREERGWWSKRFHEVFFELSKQDVPQC